MEAFLWVVFIVSILLFVNSIRQIVQAPKKKAVCDHHELSWKLTNKGLDTNSLKTAKECYYGLSRNYEGIRSYANANARSCYEDDIEEVRQNAECLAEERWGKRAKNYLLKMEQAYNAIANYNFRTVEVAYKSKSVLIKAYDDLFDWTRECYEDNRAIWKDVNVWDMAKEAVGSILVQYDSYVLWDDRTGNRATVRQQLIATLDKRIEAMRPEYQRKTKLRSLIMQEIANHETVQRSHLLNTHFNGFVSGEINACYRGLIQEHSVIEYKQGSVYFVILSDAMKKKFTPSSTKPQKEKSVQSKEEAPRSARTVALEEEVTVIASRTKLLYRELIRHFDEEGIEYIDKTTNGGGLYFFSEAEAENLKKKDYPVAFAEKGTKGTDHRPAWYIKFQ